MFRRHKRKEKSRVTADQSLSHEQKSSKASMPNDTQSVTSESDSSVGPGSGEEAERTLSLRVLLDQVNDRTHATWHLQCAEGCIAHPLGDQSKSKRLPKVVDVTCKRGRLFVNKKRLGVEAMVVRPQNGAHITYCGTTYAGSFLFLRHKGVWHCINMLSLEDYVLSVLRWEGWPGWPHEINCAFAVMCRTYACAKISEIRRKDGTRARQPYDIKATNSHQTYKGVHAFSSLQRAVDETAGMVMTYAGKPIVAMYDICCGGVVPARIAGVDFAKAPYLARSYPCTYCQKCSMYSWRLRYTASDFHDIIRQDRRDAVPVSDIAVSKRDDAGVVREIEIQTYGTRYALSGSKMYRLCKDIKSYCFSVHRSGKEIIFDGYGWGHHLGLCQWGARQMVREGWKYKEILAFFYPGVRLSYIEVT